MPIVQRFVPAGLRNRRFFPLRELNAAINGRLIARPRLLDIHA
jgi:hypothetical protein